MTPRRAALPPLLGMALAAVLAMQAANSQPEGQAKMIQFENDYLRYAITADGKGLHSVDKRGGEDYGAARQPGSMGRITVDGRTVSLPVEFPSGSYLEFSSLTGCKLYRRQGEIVSEVAPRGETPMPEAGENEVRFTCSAPQGVSARAYLTVIGKGEVVE